MSEDEKGYKKRKIQHSTSDERAEFSFSDYEGDESDEHTMGDDSPDIIPSEDNIDEVWRQYQYKDDVFVPDMSGSKGPSTPSESHMSVEEIILHVTAEGWSTLTSDLLTTRISESKNISQALSSLLKYGGAYIDKILEFVEMDIDLDDDSLDQAMQEAINDRDYDLIEKFFRAGASPYTHLQTAIDSRDYDLIKLFKEEEPDFDYVDVSEIVSDCDISVIEQLDMLEDKFIEEAVRNHRFKALEYFLRKDFSKKHKVFLDYAMEFDDTYLAQIVCEFATRHAGKEVYKISGQYLMFIEMFLSVSAIKSHDEEALEAMMKVDVRIGREHYKAAIESDAYGILNILEVDGTKEWVTLSSKGHHFEALEFFYDTAYDESVEDEIYNWASEIAKKKNDGLIYGKLWLIYKRHQSEILNVIIENKLLLLHNFIMQVRPSILVKRLTDKEYVVISPLVQEMARNGQADALTPTFADQLAMSRFIFPFPNKETLGKVDKGILDVREIIARSDLPAEIKETACLLGVSLSVSSRSFRDSLMASPIYDFPMEYSEIYQRDKINVLTKTHRRYIYRKPKPGTTESKVDEKKSKSPYLALDRGAIHAISSAYMEVDTGDHKYPKGLRSTKGDSEGYNQILQFRLDTCHYILGLLQRKEAQVKVGVYNDYPCLMVYVKSDPGLGKMKLQLSTAWTQVVASLLVGTVNYLAQKEGVGIELLRRAGFGFLAPSISICGRNIRINVGLIPKEYANILAKSLNLLSSALARLYCPDFRDEKSNAISKESVFYSKTKKTVSMKDRKAYVVPKTRQKTKKESERIKLNKKLKIQIARRSWLERKQTRGAHAAYGKETELLDKPIKELGVIHTGFSKSDFKSVVKKEKLKICVPESVYDALWLKLDAKLDGKRVVEVFSESTFARDKLSIMVFNELSSKSKIDEIGLSDCFLKSLSFCVNRELSINTKAEELEYKPSGVIKPKLLPDIKKIKSKDEAFYITLSYLFEKIKSNLPQNPEIPGKFLKLQQNIFVKLSDCISRREVNNLYFYLEYLNELLYVHALYAKKFLEKGEGFGSDSEIEDSEHDVRKVIKSKKIYGKKITVDFGMRAVLAGLHASTHYMKNIIDHGKHKPLKVKLFLYQSYFETLQAIKVFEDSADFVREKDLSKASVFIHDLNGCVTSGKVPKELNFEDIRKFKVWLLDSTSSTTMQFHRWVQRFRLSKEVKLLIFVSSGFKHEQLGADKNNYGQIRIFSKNKEELGAIYQFVRSDQYSLNAIVSHSYRRLMKKLGFTPTNQAILFGDKEVISSKDSKIISAEKGVLYGKFLDAYKKRQEKLDKSSSVFPQIMRRDYLKEEANKYGFACEDVKRDGSCFYHAVSHQLNRYHNIIVSADRLREIVTNHVIDNLNLYKRALLDVDRFIWKMSQPGQWADHLHLVALSRALSFNIVIVRDDRSKPNIQRLRSSNGTLYLGYEVGMHYQSLIKKEGSVEVIAQSKIENSIRSADIDSFHYKNLDDLGRIYGLKKSDVSILGDAKASASSSSSISTPLL